MTTDVLENALAFATSKEHTGDLHLLFHLARCACRTLAKEVERLTAIVDKLDKTADNVPAVSDMVLYVVHPETGAISTWRVDAQPNTVKLRSASDGDDYYEFTVSDSYSTREAAEAAGRNADA